MATFTLNNVRTQALYTPEGEFIGTNQAINLEELPVRAKREFAKKYDGYTVKEAIRFEGSQESAYYISAENEKGSVILKVEDSGSISTVRNSRLTNTEGLQYWGLFYFYSRFNDL
jgi:hypothetical protein